MKHVIEGTYWCAGNDIYIDAYDDDGYTIVYLNDFIKHNVKEESKVTIVINVEEN